ncbi:GNAT family N-acetyltransferase [Defluviimonas aestuarii]|uniref:GNAT family N-acetyltransferase n=1 Tax=Albidovulum aestuarii TaxID=1130726 RepID=UPI00249A715C|nr:GNAT family N-acetyltransferase [Defluviimonas aestuarii]MDI3337107.1 GNAT family N-acetyltransferase [Defluviimonas aestuarii]
MIIRDAGGGDADTIWAMLEPVFRAGNTYAIDRDIPREAALAYWMGGHVFLAEEGGQPLGTFYIQRNRPGGGAHYCNCGFVTAPGSEGRGVARVMLDHALVKARALGFEAMVFNFVVASNTRAVALWQRYGFEEVGRVPGAFRQSVGEDADALVMFRRL